MSDEEDSIQQRLKGKPVDKDAKREKLMKNIRTDFRTQQGNRVVKVETKNIVIIGRSRTGKSTIKGMLVDPAATPNDISLLSGTRDATLESFFIDGKNMILNIIDTPGVFEHHSEAALARDNEKIMGVIEKCINMEITKYHLICFAFSMPAGIQSDDIEALELFIERLGPSLSQNSCLVITRCETKTQEQRHTLKQELENDQYFKKVGHYFKRGIFFTGAINYDDYLAASSAIIDQYMNVVAYRNDLLNEFAKNCEPFQVNQSHISEFRRFEMEYENKCKELEARLLRATAKDSQQRQEIERQKRELAAEKQRAMSESGCSVS